MTEDLIKAGFDAHNLPLEIECRGVRNAANFEYIWNQGWIRAIKKLKGAIWQNCSDRFLQNMIGPEQQSLSGGELIKVQT